MKVMFTHDHRFYEEEGKLYSEVEFGYTMWKRYLKVFDEVVIASRILKVSKSQEISNMNHSNDKGVNYVSVPSISGLKNRIKNYKKAAKVLEREILEVDGVIARLPSEIGLLSVLICKKINKPFLIELVGCPKDAYMFQGSLTGKIYSPIISFRTKQAVSQSQFVLYVTKKYLQEKYPNKNHTIDCSNVELNFNEDIISIRHKNKKNNDEKIKIGLIGSLATDYKGIDVAIEALKNLENKNVELFIVGKGNIEKWKNLSELHGVDKRTHFLGSMKSGRDILNWLDTLDLYIQPSKTEGLPRALVEAMSRRLPALASNVGGIPELLSKEFLHNPGDYKALASQIEAFINNPELMLHASTINYENSKKYSIDVLQDKRTNILNSFKSYIEEK